MPRDISSCFKGGLRCRTLHRLPPGFPRRALDRLGCRLLSAERTVPPLFLAVNKLHPIAETDGISPVLKGGVSARE